MKMFRSAKTALFLGTALLTILAMNSCQKDNNSNSGGGTGNDTAVANLSAATTLADNAYDDIFQTAVQAGYDNNIAYKAQSAGTGQTAVNSINGTVSTLGVNSCAVYTVTPNDLTTFPKTIVVDFGSGCTDANGVTRKGKVTYVYSAKLITPGMTVSATFTNYSVAGYQLQGSYTLTNNSSLANGVAFATQVTGGSIVFPDSRTFSYMGSKTVKQIAGITTTMDNTDDVYSITGNNTFTGNGDTLLNTITTPLQRAYTCRFVGSGIISFVYNSHTSGNLDFGNGACDGDVTIKVGNYTKTLTFQ